MSVILVAEQDAGFVRQIVSALRSEGWTTRPVDSRAAALRSADAEMPSLVLASSTLPEAAQLLGAFARSRGGPGSVVLVAEGDAGGVSAADYQADGMLTKPCSDEDLRQAVRQCLSVSAPESPPPKRITRQLTSAEIFGDVLAEVEAEAERARKARARSRSKQADNEIERRLEETLSGVLSVDEMRRRSKKKAAKSSGPGNDAEIDTLLGKTLASLEQPSPTVAAPAAPPLEATPPSPMPETREDPALSSDAPPTLAFDFSQPPPTITVEPIPETETPPADSATDIRFSDPEERDGEIVLTQPFPIVTGSPDPGRPDPEKPEPAKAPPEEPTDGTAFGDYTLLDRIAVGGMAEVWRARRRGVEGFQKTVAIKKILAHLTDSSDFVTMLIDEAKLAAQLSHHNIIQIYDLGKVGDDFFIAMEYVEGKDLRSILNVAEEKNWPLPIGLALLIVDAVARALDYAHRKRDFEDRELELVHRDVSPQNVLISYEGEIKLCDFGIVKAVSKASTTQMGALKGKLQYMSPEQAWGRSVDARSDIFSLGSVFFELLTGSKLFTGDSEISVLDAVRECPPRSPREIVPAIPKEVESIVQKALAKSPEDRYQRAGDMEHDIKSVLDLIKPTPGLKDLASYMDALFRRTGLPGSGLPGPGLPGPGQPAAAAAARPSTEASKAEAAARPARKTAGGGNRIAKLLAAAVLAGVLAGAAYLFLRGPLSGTAETEPAPSPAAATPPAPTSPSPDSAAEDPASAAGDTEGRDTEDPATADGVEAAAGGGEQTAGGTETEELPLDLEQLVAAEVSKRRQEMERDFEEQKRLLEQEIERAKKASEENADEGGGQQGEEDPSGRGGGT